MWGTIKSSWRGSLFPPRQHDAHVQCWRWWKELQQADARGRNANEYVRYLEKVV
jgi:hypothetical protein